MALASCDAGNAAPGDATVGGGLEQAAIARGLIADPRTIDPTGVYASDTDTVCVAPLEEGTYRIAAMVDYGDGQNCAASGTATGRDRLQVDFGEECLIEARVEPDRITFPATLPPGCSRRCIGRTSLGALRADRASGSAAEARSFATPDGKRPCG